MSKVFNVVYLILLTLFSIFVLLDTFVISEVYQRVDDDSAKTTEISSKKESSADDATATITDTSYHDENIDIELNTYREHDTTIYVARVTADRKYLKTAFAKNSYGKNVTAKTSVIADSVKAILAINGDYYGAQEKGYVLKNGVIYRDEAVSGREDLVIYQDGSMEIITESEVPLEKLFNNGAYHVLSFGPGLIIDGKISLGEDDEVGKAMANNPRTAIGVLEDGTILFVVSDGRTDESEGLSLYELAVFMQSCGCTLAYNLDGGGSSTMYFNGSVVNNPTTNGRRISERSVSDIVYIGY